jgi:hypothetical protein
MNATTMNVEMDTIVNYKKSSFWEEAMFFVKTSVAMTAMVVLLASTWF